MHDTTWFDNPDGTTVKVTALKSTPAYVVELLDLTTMRRLNWLGLYDDQAEALWIAEETARFHA